MGQDAEARGLVPACGPAGSLPVAWLCGVVPAPRPQGPTPPPPHTHSPPWLPARGRGWGQRRGTSPASVLGAGLWRAQCPLRPQLGGPSARCCASMKCWPLTPHTRPQCSLLSAPGPRGAAISFQTAPDWLGSPRSCPPSGTDGEGKAVPAAGVDAGLSAARKPAPCAPRRGWGRRVVALHLTPCADDSPARRSACVPPAKTSF